MNRRLLMGAAALATIGWGSCEMSGVAHAANCGGQGAAPQPVPYTCTLPGRDITVNGITRHFSAVVTANGTTVVVTYTMTGGLLPVDIPVQINHHTGVSGNPGTPDSAKGKIPAGQTTVTVSDSSPCRDGQLDVFAVATGPNFRVGGPWIQNGTGCTAPTTVPQSSTTVTPPSSTVPSPVATTTIPGTPSVPVESSAPTTGGGTHPTRLPATGSNGAAVGIGLGLLVGGLLLLTAAVRRRAS